MIAFPPMNALHLILDHLDKLHALCHDQSCRTDSFLHDGHFVCANHCISECCLCLLFLHVYHSGDTLDYLDCAMSSTSSNYKSLYDNRFHGDEDHDPRSDLSQGGGDDAVHPTIIPMYTSTTPQAPRGHTMRPRPYAIGHKVNSLLFEPSLSTYETWLLPHAWTLHILRYNRDDHGGSKDQGQAWKRRRKKKQGQASGKPGTSGLCPELSAPGPSDLPGTSSPGVQTSPECANSLDSPEPGRNLPGTSGSRNFRPRPELPALPARSHLGRGPCTLSSPRLYILYPVQLSRVSVG